MIRKALRGEYIKSCNTINIDTQYRGHKIGKQVRQKYRTKDDCKKGEIQTFAKSLMLLTNQISEKQRSCS